MNTKMYFITILFTTLSFCSCNEYSIKNPPEYNNPNNQNPTSPHEDDLNRFNFDYFLGFQLNSGFYSETTNSYIYDISIGWGVPNGIYSRGINQFGIEIKLSDGDLSYMETKDVYIKDNKPWTYFSGFIYDNSAYTWNTNIFIESNKKNISLNYKCKFYDTKTGKYVIPHVENTKTFYVNY